MIANRAMWVRVCTFSGMLMAAACGGSSGPTAPVASAAATVTPTRIIDVSGNLAFGTVNIGDTAQRTLTISNSGNSTLTFTSLSASGGTGTAGYTASPTSGTVAAGSSTTVTIFFKPLVAQFYSNVLTVVGDQTSGNAAINISGTGFNPNPIYSRSGSGDNVFDIPSYVTRIRIQGTYQSCSSNFIVRVAGRLIVNELLGSCWTSRSFDGTYALTAGGTTEITNSSGVSWTFTEIR